LSVGKKHSVIMKCFSRFLFPLVVIPECFYRESSLAVIPERPYRESSGFYDIETAGSLYSCQRA
jgi:hypothetical protein